MISQIVKGSQKARRYHLFGFGNGEQIVVVRGFKGKFPEAVKFAESEAVRMGFGNAVII